jgi:hypothetical protein
VVNGYLTAAFIHADFSNSAKFVSLWVAALLVALSKVPSGSTQRDSRPAHFVSSFRFVLSWSDPNKIAGFDLVLPRD